MYFTNSQLVLYKPSRVCRTNDMAREAIMGCTRGISRLRVGGPGTPPFGARGRSSVRYGTRLGDLKNKHSTHTLFGKSGLQGLSTRVALPLRDIQLRLSKGATGVPLFTTWDSVAGPGRTPMPGNNSGRRQPGNSAVPSTVGRLGVDGFWVRDYGGGSG